MHNLRDGRKNMLLKDFIEEAFDAEENSLRDEVVRLRRPSNDEMEQLRRSQWTVYKITHCPSGREYIGLTNKDAEERLNCHFEQATRAYKTRGISQHSLGYAIREERKKSAVSYKKKFLPEVLKVCETPEAAAKAEQEFIEKNKTMAPNGFNILRGGSSLGGPGNSIPFVLIYEGIETAYQSVTDLCRDRIQMLGLDISPVAYLGRIRVRLRSGWSLAEAFDYVEHEDNRSTSLSRLAKKNGSNLESLRSAAWQAENAPRRVDKPGNHYRLPHPENSHWTVNASEFARITGQAVTTVMRRANQLGSELYTLSHNEVVKFLTVSQEGNTPISVRLPDGRLKEWNSIREAAEERAWITGCSESKYRKRLQNAFKSGRRSTRQPTNEELLIALEYLETPLPSTRVLGIPVYIRKRLDSMSLLSRSI